MAAKVEGGNTSSCNSVDSRQLNSLLKRLVNDIDIDFQKETEEKSELLQHLKNQCSSLLQSFQLADGVKSNDLKAVLKDAARLVLDFTFIHETLLVDSAFPADSADTTIAAIQENLDRIFHVAKAMFPDETAVEMLGEEVTECVHWRKGGLLYMFSHTVESEGRQVDPSYYKQCLEDGVLELDKMLTTRKPIKVPSDVGADDTLQLFGKGVYSDVHLLAMMYAAEMCYWYQQAMDKGCFTSGPVSEGRSFKARQKGLCYLENYLSTVRGPLKGQGWSTSRAEEIMQYLRHCQ